MSTDQQLLEAAARAVGIGPVLCYEAERNCLRIGDRQSYRLWRPLTDRGDALVLLAAMPGMWGLSLTFGPIFHLEVARGFGEITTRQQVGSAGARATPDEKAEALCRVIVRAAAACDQAVRTSSK